MYNENKKKIHQLKLEVKIPIGIYIKVYEYFFNHFLQQIF